MTNHSNNQSPQHRKEVYTPTATRRLASGELIELLYDRNRGSTSLLVAKDGDWHAVSSYKLPSGETLIPYRPGNSLIRHGVVLLPEQPEDFESAEALLEDILAFIHRYVALTPDFELLTAYYVLFSWVYDAFNEVPYLRILGEYGTGKTRFLLVTGALSMRPVFASGASTVSPIFHALDAFQGTLVIDEADFRFSDEKSEIVKILNNGNVRGLPVLRTEINAAKEFSPRAFSVFGPKIVAIRKPYEDDALESRFLTERAGFANLRDDIPINLPDDYRAEAQALRNKLLAYRLRTLSSTSIDQELTARTSPRQSQILRPLLSIIGDSDHQMRIDRFVSAANGERSTPQAPVEKELLAVLVDLIRAGDGDHVTLRSITSTFAERHGDRYGVDPSPRWVGYLLRKRLGLHPRKIQGVFAIGREERARVAECCARFGVPSPSEEPDLVWETMTDDAQREEPVVTITF